MKTKTIIQLILRDLSVQRKLILILSFFVLVFGMFIIFVNTNTLRMFTSTVGIIIVTPIAPFFGEMKNKGVWIHTLSLPITRKEMVLARYLTSILIALVNLLLWVSVFSLLLPFIKPGSNVLINSTLVVSIFSDLVFHLSLFYIVYYRFSFPVTMIIYLVIMMYPGLSKAFTGLEVLAVSQLKIKALPWLPVSILVGASMFIASLSYSITHFKKKDI